MPALSPIGAARPILQRGALPLFPPGNWWNVDISAAPVDPDSAGFVQRRRAEDSDADRHAPVPTSLTLSPTAVVGGSSAAGTVTLSGPAPSGGVVVTLKSSRPAQAIGPASVTGPAGQTSATFSVTTTPVTANTSAWISATYRETTKGATLTITR